MIIKAPNSIYNLNPLKRTVFLAGSIEMGQAEDWQTIASNELQDKYNILNPRRDDWDSSWTQSYENINFRDQVRWEQESILNCEIVLFNFFADTLSPITLLEFGLVVGFNKVVRRQRIIVVCPKEFWRHGNIEIMCHINNIELYDDISMALMVLQ